MVDKLMFPKPIVCLIFFNIIPLLVACQTYERDSTFQSIAGNTLDLPETDDSLLEENGRLDLSLETLEQQSKDKAEAAKKLATAREQRVVVETEESPQKGALVNIASFARSTINEIGQPVYTRPSYHALNHWTECAILSNDDNAQRFFLQNGGPKMDPKNLDPDGDGFACAWDPSIYRQLAIPED